jgi:hypothetical protein
MPKMTEEKMLRAADLHWAYQCGQEAAQGDATAEAEFKSKCAGDAEAEREFQRGVAEQQGRQLGVAKSVH